MGVLGLAPFLQKVCPDVFRELPNRLKSLRGKTIVLDATLVTTRFHFAQIPHERRHILFWYRLLSELRQNDVKVMCVFDGKERTRAKKAENARRRDLRHLSLARGNLEESRAHRLRQLEQLLSRMQPDTLLRNAPIFEKLAQAAQVASGSSHVPGLAGLGIAREIAAKRVGRSRSWPTDADSPPFTEEGASIIAREDPPESDISGLTKSMAGLEVTSPEHPGDAAKDLEGLFEKYTESLQLLPSAEPLVVPDALELETGQQPGTSDAALLSQSQRELALAEGQIWASLPRQESGLDEAIYTVSLLADRSELISRSYRRSSELPNAQTFLESKVMIEAMGVPCIETDPPFEAEALASSLVLNGLADYVASEDTDVLVYQAPLIRNITSQAEPLVLIFGQDIPSALHISVSSFVDFAILIGTDFSPRLKGLGPNRALKLIRSHDTIERVLTTTTPRFGPDPRQSLPDYLEQVAAARHVFTTLPPPPPPSKLVPRNEYDVKLVHDILEQYDLSRLAARLVQDDTEASGSLKSDYFASDHLESNLYI